MDELVIKSTDKEIAHLCNCWPCPIPSAVEFGVEFDEVWYVRSNPDIAKPSLSRRTADGHNHE
jgi:hypothetical protein